MRLSAFQDPQAGNNSQGAHGFSLSDATAQSFPEFVGDVAHLQIYLMLWILKALAEQNRIHKATDWL